VLAIRYVGSPELVSELGQVLAGEMGNHDVRGKVRYDLLDDIERISRSVNDVLLRKLVGVFNCVLSMKLGRTACSIMVSDFPNGTMRNIRCVSCSVNPTCTE
jgi:hypothetical protein